jgi:hypothetical protein
MLQHSASRSRQLLQIHLDRSRSSSRRRRKSPPRGITARHRILHPGCVKPVRYRNLHPCSQCHDTVRIEMKRCQIFQSRRPRPHQQQVRLCTSGYFFPMLISFVVVHNTENAQSHPQARPVKSAAARTLEGLLSQVESETDKKVIIHLPLKYVALNMFSFSSMLNPSATHTKAIGFTSALPQLPRRHHLARDHPPAGQE